MSKITVRLARGLGTFFADLHFQRRTSCDFPQIQLAGRHLRHLNPQIQRAFSTDQYFHGIHCQHQHLPYPARLNNHGSSVVCRARAVRVYGVLP